MTCNDGSEPFSSCLASPHGPGRVGASTLLTWATEPGLYLAKSEPSSLRDRMRTPCGRRLFLHRADSGGPAVGFVPVPVQGLGFDRVCLLRHAHGPAVNKDLTEHDPTLPFRDSIPLVMRRSSTCSERRLGRQVEGVTGPRQPEGGGCLLSCGRESHRRPGTSQGFFRDFQLCPRGFSLSKRERPWQL